MSKGDIWDCVKIIWLPYTHTGFIKTKNGKMFLVKFDILIELNESMKREITQAIEKLRKEIEG